MDFLIELTWDIILFSRRLMGPCSIPSNVEGSAMERKESKDSQWLELMGKALGRQI